MSKFPRKVLVSYGYGAGWSTWVDREYAQAAAEYQPLIEFLEAGGDTDDLTDDHPLMQRINADLGEPYTGGLRGVAVVTVYGPYRINEYDGSESIEEFSEGSFYY